MGIYRTNNVSLAARIGRMENDLEATKASYGKTAQRPVHGSSPVSAPYFDNELQKPVWWNGQKWLTAAGADA